MLYIIGFIVILGPLVVFHEFGHYLFARLFNVKAEVFSIGFGPKLWARQRGETEWRLSAFPLGGYVKLLGEDPEAKLSPEERKRSLPAQEPWKRFLIFFGGPLFNFILAIFIFMIILAVGEEHLSSRISRVVTGSKAYQVGFRSGDKVVSVAGQPVDRFEDLLQTIMDHPGKELTFQVERGQPGTTLDRITVQAVPEVQEGFSVYGEQTNVGEIEGLIPQPRSTAVGISDPKTAAARAGLKTGDVITAVNSQKVETFEQVEEIYRGLDPGQAFELSVGDQTIGLKIPTAKPGSIGQAFGIHSVELFIDRTIEGSPAESAGLKSGDRIVSIAKNPTEKPVQIQSFFALRDLVQRNGEESGKITLTWERGGSLFTKEIIPNATTSRDAMLKKVTQYTIGVVPIFSFGKPEVKIERIFNPFTLLWKGTERMALFTARNVVGIAKMITGDVSIKTLGGPILIGKLAGESMSRGLNSFLTMMAILSIGLGVLNLLPVPVLDGGHLMLLTIEWIRGKPLTLRQMEVLQQVGLSLILLLMVVVMKNDFSRLPIFQ